ncbi:uncharacterized protein [Onthophagus taurus]|uniref:uncharacterized protein n=1 Tax=Onthophagus taurus TaxID=166361 RepID=UPI000C204DBB|nr:uncharacterized protein LOC111424110 [Onthophagus taurus]
MKSSASTNKVVNPSFSVKTKKSSKDREKRKSSSSTEKLDNNSEKGSPNKDGTVRKYAGIGPESILTYSEQAGFEHLSEDVCYGLAEDISYKLRYVIHDSLIKARLSGRNHILSTDLDATFQDLNIDKVYGATSTPNWIGFGDQNLYYLDDPMVNLIELSEQPCSFTQPGEVVVNKKWVPDTKDTEVMRNYFKTMCSAIVSNNQELSQYALNDIKQNTHIGPITDWFYHFGYLLLSKDITYDSLTTSALSLIKCLEQNQIAILSVSEKPLKLLVRLLLQRLLRGITTPEVLKPMCSVLAILCERLPLREFVIVKLNQKIKDDDAKIKENFLLSIVSIINALGVDAIFEIFVPLMNYILTRIEVDQNSDLIYAILQTYTILNRECDHTEELDKAFYETFGDGICPIWEITPTLIPEKQESNWFQIKIQLFKTRRKILYSNKHQTHIDIKEIFSDYVEPDDDAILKSDFIGERTGIHFQIKRLNVRKPLLPAITDIELRNSLSIYGTDDYNPDISFLSELINSQPTQSVLIGKRSLLLSCVKGDKVKVNNRNRCNDYNLMYYNY